MAFNNPSFLFLFLPLFFGCYFAAPIRFRNLVLLAFSLGFYCIENGAHVVLLLGVTLIAYVSGYAMRRSPESGRGLIAKSSFFLVLSVLVYFKYWNFLRGQLSLSPLEIVLPVGISFFVFQAISYVEDCRRSQVIAQSNPVSFFVYLSMFPHLIAGPIVRYADIQPDIENRRFDPMLASSGVRRFIFGLAKKVLIADQLSTVPDRIFSLPIVDVSSGAM